MCSASTTRSPRGRPALTLDPASHHLHQGHGPHRVPGRDERVREGEGGTFTTLPLASWTNGAGEVVSALPFDPGGGTGNLTRMYDGPDAGSYVRIVGYDGRARGSFARTSPPMPTPTAMGLPDSTDFSDPVAWVNVVGQGASAVLAAVLIIRAGRALALPPPPTEFTGMPTTGLHHHLRHRH